MMILIMTQIMMVMMTSVRMVMTVAAGTKVSPEWMTAGDPFAKGSLRLRMLIELGEHTFVAHRLIQSSD